MRALQGSPEPGNSSQDPLPPEPGLGGQGKAVNGRRLYTMGAPATLLDLSHTGHQLPDGEGWRV